MAYWLQHEPDAKAGCEPDQCSQLSKKNRNFQEWEFLIHKGKSNLLFKV